jgi:hypothetical protein
MEGVFKSVELGEGGMERDEGRREMMLGVIIFFIDIDTIKLPTHEELFPNEKVYNILANQEPYFIYATHIPPVIKGTVKSLLF